MKVGIVVPYSWSFGGGVVDHADAQARALETVGIETRLLIGNDPPGSFSRVLHPRQGRPGPPLRTEHVTSRDRGDLISLDQVSALRALACARRAEKNQVHLNRSRPEVATL